MFNSEHANSCESNDLVLEPTKLKVRMDLPITLQNEYSTTFSWHLEV